MDLTYYELSEYLRCITEEITGKPVGKSRAEDRARVSGTKLDTITDSLLEKMKAKPSGKR